MTSARKTPPKVAVTRPDSATMMMMRTTLATMTEPARHWVNLSCVVGTAIGPIMFGLAVNLMSGISA